MLETVIGQIARGDRTAFQRLYDETSAQLYGLCLRILNDRAEAEDMLQQVYSTLWRDAGGFASAGLSVNAWSVTICRAIALDRLRARRSDGASMDEVVELVDQVITSNGSEFATQLAELPHDISFAIRRAYLDGDSYADLAERFETSADASRARIGAALSGVRLEGSEPVSVLAAEYTLGLLSDADARMFEIQLSQSAALQSQYIRWSENLASLAQSVPQMPPPQGTFDAINKRVFPEASKRWWSRLGLIEASVGAIAAAGFGAVVIWYLAAQSMVGVIGDHSAQIIVPERGLIVTVNYQSQTGLFGFKRPVGGPSDGRVFELWVTAENSTDAVSFGVLPDAAQGTLPVAGDLIGLIQGGTISLSEEPVGGAPLGIPTKPILGSVEFVAK